MKERKTLRMSFYAGCSNINGRLSLHTPIGTTYVSLGTGPCYVQAYSSTGTAYQGLDLGTRFILGHRAFATRNLFFYFEVDVIYFSRGSFISTAFSRQGAMKPRDSRLRMVYSHCQ